MRDLELLIPTLFGLEGLCANELRRLELPRVLRGVPKRAVTARRPLTHSERSIRPQPRGEGGIFLRMGGQNYETSIFLPDDRASLEA